MPMNPKIAGELCADLDKCLRGESINLNGVVALIVTVIREGAWKRRQIRTGEIIECSSFLELLTAEPLRGYGENPARVEALLKDDADALRMFREATTAAVGTNQHTGNVEPNNNIITPKQGTSRAYTLERLHRQAPELYQQVVEKKLTANQAAIRAGFRKVKTVGDQLCHLWLKATDEERESFLDFAKGRYSHAIT